MLPPDELLYFIPEEALLDYASGGFARRVLLIQPAAPPQSGNRDFLVKILAAVQLHLEKDVLLVSLPAGARPALLPTLRQKQPEHILVFGLAPRDLGLNFEAPLYQPFSFYSATFLFAEGLDILEPDKHKKGLLWRALQALFL